MEIIIFLGMAVAFVIANLSFATVLLAIEYVWGRKEREQTGTTFLSTIL